MGILDRLLSMLGDGAGDGEPEQDDTSNESTTRMWTNHSGGYYVCSHVGCSKKADWQITDHDCCGRCSQGRTCRTQAAENYAGPGSFAHKYFETMLEPGVCKVCGEPPEAH